MSHTTRRRKSRDYEKYDCQLAGSITEQVMMWCVIFFLIGFFSFFFSCRLQQQQQNKRHRRTRSSRGLYNGWIMVLVWRCFNMTERTFPCNELIKRDCVDDAAVCASASTQRSVQSKSVQGRCKFPRTSTLSLSLGSAAVAVPECCAWVVVSMIHHRPLMSTQLSIKSNRHTHTQKSLSFSLSRRAKKKKIKYLNK